ncbi:hypothetical protein [Sorangium sp. So ce1389]|uniref:hypothetical protein n=1 Tax=Sorangium sp. So ce1389 TaxID=3133336 RepID=UPI003F5D8DD6
MTRISRVAGETRTFAPLRSRWMTPARCSPASARDRRRDLDALAQRRAVVRDEAPQRDAVEELEVEDRLAVDDASPVQLADPGHGEVAEDLELVVERGLLALGDELPRRLLDGHLLAEGGAARGVDREACALVKDDCLHVRSPRQNDGVTRWGLATWDLSIMPSVAPTSRLEQGI